MEIVKTFFKYLFMPIIFIWIVTKFLLKQDIQESIDSINNANNKDEELKQDQDSANNQANQHLDNANQIAEDKIEMNVNNIDPDWHKKVH
jgi:mannitol-specific phosphotransferase system IIBC component